MPTWQKRRSWWGCLTGWKYGTRNTGWHISTRSRRFPSRPFQICRGPESARFPERQATNFPPNSSILRGAEVHSSALFFSHESRSRPMTLLALTHLLAEVEPIAELRNRSDSLQVFGLLQAARPA